MCIRDRLGIERCASNSLISILKCDRWDWRIKIKSIPCSSWEVKKEVFLSAMGSLEFRMKEGSKEIHEEVLKAKTSFKRN